MPRRHANTHDPDHAMNMAIAGIEDTTAALDSAAIAASKGDTFGAYESLQDAKRYLAASQAHVHYASGASDFASLSNDIYRNYEDLNAAIASLEKRVVYPRMRERARNRSERPSRKREDVNEARTRKANTHALKNRLV